MTRYRAYCLTALLTVGTLSPACAATWTIDTGKSALAFTGTQTGASFTGHFGQFGGDISFDPAHPEAGHAKITIDLASAKTGDPQRDGAMPGKDWFDIALFPKAIFETTAIHRAGADTYIADGTLTIRGVAKPVALPFSLTITHETAVMHGDVKFSRSLFGVGQGPWASGEWVGLDVGVHVDLVAHAAQ